MSGCELDGLKVPVGGDQLTRVRLQGAKALRAGALTPEDRFEHLEPVIVEMFHTQQDLLEVSVMNMSSTNPITISSPSYLYTKYEHKLV